MVASIPCIQTKVYTAMLAGQILWTVPEKHRQKLVPTTLLRQNIEYALSRSLFVVNTSVLLTEGDRCDMQ